MVDDAPSDAAVAHAASAGESIVASPDSTELAGLARRATHLLPPRASRTGTQPSLLRRRHRSRSLANSTWHINGIAGRSLPSPAPMERQP